MPYDSASDSKSYLSPHTAMEHDGYMQAPPAPGDHEHAGHELMRNFIDAVHANDHHAAYDAHAALHMHHKMGGVTDSDHTASPSFVADRGGD